MKNKQDKSDVPEPGTNSHDSHTKEPVHGKIIHDMDLIIQKLLRNV